MESKKYNAEVSVMVVQVKLRRIKKNMSEKYHAHASDRSQILFLNDAGKVSKKVKTFTDEGGCIVPEMSELL